MAHSAKQFHESDKQPLGAKANKAFFAALLLGVIGLGGAIALAFSQKDAGLTHFGFAYLTSFIWVLGITLGCLFITVVTHVFRAGWIVVVRRLFETVAVNIWLVALLAVPIVFFAVAKPGALYPWSQTQKVVHDTAEDSKAFLENVDAAVAGHELKALSKDSQYAQVDIKTGRPDNAMPYADASSEYSNDRATAEAQQKAHWWILTKHILEYKAWGGDHGFSWYQPVFFAIRILTYFLIWFSLAFFYWKHSTSQDEDKNVSHTHKREWWGPLGIILFAVTTTLAVYDLVVSLEPAWFSTMFGVYFFANCTLSGLCVVSLATIFLSKKGLLKTASTDHLHDLGKLMFAFTFFWGYVAYSQYMLIWYASLPEETYWFEIRGVTTVGTAPQYGSPWSVIAIALLVCHLFIPFAFLLSHHVKRNRVCLAIAAVWLLAVVWLDFYWLIMPSYSFLHTGKPAIPEFGPMEVLCFLGIAGIAAAGVIRRLSKVSLIAHGDPRLHESVALDTNVWTPMYSQDAH